MLKCEICGCEFNAVIERHYIARGNGKTGFQIITGGDESAVYDAFDCPQCGCQHIAQERKREFFAKATIIVPKADEVRKDVPQEESKNGGD